MAPSMCALCVRSPSGIAGHEGLALSDLKADFRPVFVCTACGSQWTRSYIGSEAFEWLKVAVPTGDRMKPTKPPLE